METWWHFIDAAILRVIVLLLAGQRTVYETWIQLSIIAGRGSPQPRRHGVVGRRAIMKAEEKIAQEARQRPVVVLPRHPQGPSTAFM